MKRLACLLALLFLAGAVVHAQEAKKPLTLELVARPQGLMAPGLSRVEWRPGSNEISYLKRQGFGRGASATIYIYDIASRKERVLLGPPSDTTEGGKPNLSSYQWSPRGDALLLEGEEEIWIYTLATSQMKSLIKETAPIEHATFSPTGERVAFVEENNLFELEVSTGHRERLTNDGNDNVMNGKFDWVYEEELSNRATGKAYEWSPDGKKIAYLRLDDAPVPQYPLTHYLSDHVNLTEERFPQSGDPNPVPSFHVVSLEGSQPKTWTSSVAKSDRIEYFGPSFSWTPDSKAVAFLTLDRAQDELDVHLWNAAAGTDHLLLTEKDACWINSLEPPRFLGDSQRFLWLSERDGWLHLYLYGNDGKLQKQLTHGDWMIDRPIFSNSPAIGVDEKGGWVYFAATNPDPRERHLYRVRLEGSGLEPLSKQSGVHGLNLSPDGQYLLDQFSSLNEPPETRLLKADGSLLATLSKQTGHLNEYALGKTELVEVKAPDGATLYARLVKPPDFDPARKYPVIIDVYGGPHVQVIQNRWGLTSLSDHLYAEQGFIIWSLDNRGSWGRGHAWESKVFKNLGHYELEDQLAGVAFLKSLPYVDPTRIGITGWSYGGFMTLYALTHAPGVFKCGAAGGSVTSWKFYDSIYTERYMRTPQENPEGYKTASPLEAADKLKAKILLIHGTDDDNVHMQNTLNFVEALVKARRPFELYVQPGEKHGFASEAARLYLAQRMLEFFKQNL
ncbi:MAG TPA: S9 family peptidase [Terriglobia bacterium]|nr:S9 family peptidase [Terriglobia bacterium]